MAGYFSETSFKRLPAAIRELPEKQRTAFILLRMRRGEDTIARDLGVSITEARDIIRQVQDTLVKTGSIDLIQDPVFFRIDHPRDDEGPGRPIELHRNEMDMADQVALDQFFRTLRKSVGQLPPESRRLLSLWYNKEMRAKDILNFYKRLNIPLSDRKLIGQTTEQDVFYALEKNLKKLLGIVRSNLEHEGVEITHVSLKAILNETGV